MGISSCKVALITGGGSGIGFELARQMIAKGSTVIACGRSMERLRSAKDKVPALEIVRCDVTERADREELFGLVSRRFGGLDMLVNNAGIVKRYLLPRTEGLEGKIAEEWRTNYLAPVLMARLFLPILAANKGTLVNVSSGLAHVPISIEPNYCATKAALRSMTQSMRSQFAALGVRVVEIAFPAVDTPFQDGHAPADAMKADRAAEIALKGLRAGKEEIRVGMAGLIFLLSRLAPKASFRMVNGFAPEEAERLLAGA